MQNIPVIVFSSTILYVTSRYRITQYNYLLQKMTNTIKRFTYTLLIILAVGLTASDAAAFPTDTYTTESKLASGRWTKVSVSQTGMHFIPATTLRSWGFKDISKVRIHGYGGRQLPDYLTLSSYIDDLPETPAMRTSAGIFFYAVGPVKWTASSGHYVQTLNPFSTEGFYFLSESDEPVATIEKLTGSTNGSEPVTTFESRLFHENDLTTISHSGTQLLGEDFRVKNKQSFKFHLTDMVENTPVWSRITFVTNTTSDSYLDISVAGKELLKRTLGRSDADVNYGVKGTYNISFDTATPDVELTLNYTNNGTVSAAHLDAITLNYTRKLRLSGGLLDFNLNSTSAIIEGTTDKTHVWDVTDICKPFELSATVSGTSLQWVNPYTGGRTYAAWDETAKMPAPKLVGTIANQNIHGITEIPDMIIITVKDFAGEAERVAALHRKAPDNFNVLVVNQDDVFNEFSSGTQDVGAFRRMLKMFYDRGREAGKLPRYCLLFGRGTFDIRRMTSEIKALNEPMMPSWQTSESLSISGTYTSDDFIVMLEDNSGNIPAYDRISMSIGRIPARTLAQAKNYVDKIYSYLDNKYSTDWKNSILLEADNGNKGSFMVGPEDRTTTGLEGFYNSMIANDVASQFRFTKVYYDAFPLQNSACPRAEELFNLALKEGIMLWLYNGHGSQTGLGGEGIHSITKIDKMFNKQWPMLVAITCSFSQWDNANPCGVENMSFNTSGGTIATLSPTRKAFISDNDAMVMALGSTMMRRDENGRSIPIGDMITDAKNQLRSSSKSGAALSKLRLALLGDPAMRLAVADYTMTLDEAGDDEVTPDNQTTIMARQRVTLRGTVRGADGNAIDSFNGSVSLTIYDAETTTTTKGLNVDGTEGKSINFDEMGTKLFSGRGTVTNGKFTVDVAMPAEVADNFRPATVSMFASATDGTEASGVCRDLFVYGYDATAEPDSIAPTIDYAYLNHSSFTNGSTVNEKPMLIAGISDDIGINLSMAGIGHQMLLKLDDNRSFNDVALYYTPSPDGSPSGTIAYPLSEISEGHHTLTLRVWDTSGNSTSTDLTFFVRQGALPQVFDIYSDANPASTHANFYISHNRPEANATVNLEIYNIAGTRIWTSVVNGPSDMFLSTPIQWDLRDMGGRRVPRGIYIYRATIEIDGHEIATPARRIAVTGH